MLARLTPRPPPARRASSISHGRERARLRAEQLQQRAARAAAPVPGGDERSLCALRPGAGRALAGAHARSPARRYALTASATIAVLGGSDGIA